MNNLADVLHEFADEALDDVFTILRDLDDPEVIIRLLRPLIEVYTNEIIDALPWVESHLGL